MRYFLVTNRAGEARLYASSDTAPIEPYRDLVAEYQLDLREIAVPAGLHSLAALASESVLELVDRLPPKAEDPVALARAAIEAGMQRRQGGAGSPPPPKGPVWFYDTAPPPAPPRAVASGLAETVYAHARRELPARTEAVVVDEVNDDRPMPVRAAAPPPPLEDYGEGEAPPMPRRGGQGSLPSPAALDLTRAGSSTVLQVGPGGQVCQAPGWRPQQRQGDQLERAPGRLVPVKD